MRKIWIKVAAISLLCMAGTGCSTFKTQQKSYEIYGEEDAGIQTPKGNCDIALPHVFSGTVWDATLIMGPVLCDDFRHGGLEMAFWGYLALPYGLIDLPFSLVADTAILPYTIYRQSRYGNIKNSGN